jgi:hypothetical protein
MNSLEEQADLPLLTHDLADERLHSRSETPSPQIHNRYNRDAFDPLSETAAARRRRTFNTTIITSFISCLATISVIAILWAFLHERAIVTITASTPFKYDEFYSVDSPRLTGCGSTVEEAIALGCLFDELSDLWLPRKCSRKYADEYSRTNNSGPFLYWADPEGKHVITNRSQYAGGATYYSMTRDILCHCEHNMYRFADSLMTGELVGHSDTFAPHMHHCAEILGRFALRTLII